MKREDSVKNLDIDNELEEKQIVINLLIFLCLLASASLGYFLMHYLRL